MDKLLNPPHLFQSAHRRFTGKRRRELLLPALLPALLALACGENPLDTAGSRRGGVEPLNSFGRTAGSASPATVASGVGNRVPLSEVGALRERPLLTLAASGPIPATPARLTLIKRVLTADTSVCAGDSLLVQAEVVDGIDARFRIAGRRGATALVPFYAVGPRTVVVEAGSRIAGQNRSERVGIAVDVRRCPDQALAAVTAISGPGPGELSVQVRRVQGLGAPRLAASLNGLHYRFDFGDGTVVDTVNPQSTHRYDRSAGQPEWLTYVVQVRATDEHGRAALGRVSHAVRLAPAAAASFGQNALQRSGETLAVKLSRQTRLEREFEAGWRRFHGLNAVP